MLAVTTRNVLRSARTFLPMLRARRSVARQLGETPGLIRYASGVASPTEFLTLTIWEDKQAMRRFMQSGAHERFMWLFSRWTQSFWGMRWEPTEAEHGHWSGRRLASAAGLSRAVSPLVVAGLLPPNPPRAGPTGPRPESGAVEPRDCGLFAVTARFDGLGTLLTARDLVDRLGAEALGSPDLVRWSVGLDWPPAALAITVWRDTPRAPDRALTLLGEELGASWALRWRPGDYEIGHWDGLRMRLAGRRLPRPGQR